MQNLDNILKKVEKPARYIGGEFNSPKADWNKLNYCMCFPDIYEVGMSNLGVRIVAEALRTVDGVFVDRAFSPWQDFGKELKESGNLLYGLSSGRPLKDFDIVGFSLQYEMNYTTVLYMLELGGIPLRAEDRGEEYPVIQAGGPCAFNPEPLSPFFDMFVIGDGEEVMPALARIKMQTPTKAEFLKKASELDGVYVPEYTQVKYDDNGHIEGFIGKTRVKRAVCADLERAVFPEKMLVGNIETVFDRAVIEVMRGCCRNCRFCQAGFLYRPIRQRSVDGLVKTACRLIESTGYDELSLNSLSTGDYPALKQLLAELKEKLPNTKIALPSLRIDSFEGEFTEQSRKSSITFAPEAGTQRLRDVINKDITEEEINRTFKIAFEKGFTSIKLYFMMGLPTETEEDLQGIVDIVYKIREIYAENKKAARNLRISVSVSTFIPKPFTPFAWERQITREEFLEKVAFLKQRLFIKGVNFSWNDYELSVIEAVLARGDRRLADAIELAYKKGAFLESWTENFHFDKWRQAFDETGLIMSAYTGEQPLNGVLAWDIIDCLVDKKFFLAERERAYRGEVTGSCFSGCKGCGIQREYKCKLC